MRTRYNLHIGDETYLLGNEDLRNWDDIKCSYKRASFDGVVRSFSSSFEFVNEARALLLSLYLAEGFNAEATLVVETITENWAWEERFRCPLDFSTVSWDAHTLKINAIDNSLAALIKANKGTKYEFVVGADIADHDIFRFPRIPIKNSLTYEITDGDSDNDNGSLYVPESENDRVYCGLLSDDEVSINGVLDWEEDQTTDPGSWLVKAVAEEEVSIEASIVFDRCHSVSTGMTGQFVVLRADGTRGAVTDAFNFGSLLVNRGSYSSEEELRDAYPHSAIAGHENYWATVNGTVWKVVYDGSFERTDWVNQGVTESEFRRQTVNVAGTVLLHPGDKIAFEAKGKGAHVYSSSFVVSWIATGEPCNVVAHTPASLGDALLMKICEGKMNPKVVISDHDPRIAKTLVLAAESIRGIGGAKLYTSFTEYADWMSAVFGYVWYVGEETPSPYVGYEEALGGYTGNVLPLEDMEDEWEGDYGQEIAPSDIVYLQHYGKFVAKNSIGYFPNFPGHERYNDPETGTARTDTVFKLRKMVNGSLQNGLYLFVSGSFEPVKYRGKAEDVTKSFQPIHFVHRSELMPSDADVVTFGKCSDINYTVDTASIYSTVTVGYDKKDYDSINGRDEFNFSVTWSTGCTVSDKTLSLLSKYRADSYGIELAAQKRGADSTDTKSDQDVFFVHCECKNGVWKPDYTSEIEGTLSDHVFNAAFSPMACVRANAGFIGLQGAPLTLRFASSTANSEIAIDGVPLKSDIILDAPLATCGVLEFTTGEVDTEAGLDDLIEVESEGVTYRGYLKEVDYKYAKEEAAKYKIIVKEILP